MSKLRLPLSSDWEWSNTRPGPWRAGEVRGETVGIFWCQLFAIERNESYGNAALKLRKFFSFKIPIWECVLNQITINSLVFRLTVSTIIIFAFAIFEEGVTCSEMDRWLLGEELSCPVIQLILRQMLAFGLFRELHYSNETLEHWPRGTFAAIQLCLRNW